jgi:Na+-driven multidrug efflux pump
MSSAYQLKKFIDFKRIFAVFVLVSFTFGLGVNLSVVLFSNQIISYLGASFKIEEELIYVISITNLLLATQLPLGVFLNSIGKMWLGFWVNLFWAFILIVSFFCVLKANWFSGSVSLSYSYLLAYILLGVLLTIIVKKIYGKFV